MMILMWRKISAPSRSFPSVDSILPQSSLRSSGISIHDQLQELRLRYQKYMPLFRKHKSGSWSRRPLIEAMERDGVHFTDDKIDRLRNCVHKQKGRNQNASLSAQQQAQENVPSALVSEDDWPIPSESSSARVTSFIHCTR